MTAPAPADHQRAQQAHAAGMAALRSGDHAEAALAFAEATHADPGALALWSNLAHALRLSGDDAGERRALEQALAIDRVDFGTQLRMAQLLQRIGDETKAIIAWSGVQQLAANMPNLSPEIAEEVAAGRAYSQALQARIATLTSAALSPVSADWNETERRRIGAFAALGLGKRTVYQNQCAGMFYPFLPADEFFDRHHFPWFEQLEAGHAAIAKELRALLADPGEALRPYVRMDDGTPENDWTRLDGSLDWGACFLWEYGQRNDVVASRCPNTTAIVEQLPLAHIPGRAPNVFFSILRPHCRIPAHTGVTNTRAIIHLGLDIPTACGFRVGGETREWSPGQAFGFDDTIEHEAWNDSDQPRAVLILDSWNPHLSEGEQDAITRYFVASDEALATG